MKIASRFDYVTNYKRNDSLRSSFNGLVQQIFGINFESWYQKGFWNNTYVCHSIALQGQIVSNVSITRMQLIINQQKVNAIQIGTVMTHPDFRKSGLASFLMGKVFDAYGKDYEFMYLFPNESAVNFYSKFEFSLINDYIYSLTIDNNEGIMAGGLKKINIDNDSDLNIVKSITASRILRSDKFDCLESGSIFFWYCLNVFNDKIYILEPENVIVIFEENENIIDIYDIVSNKPVILSSIINRISGQRKIKIVFHFTPQFEDVCFEEFAIEKNEKMFVRPAQYLSGNAVAHPIMAHT